MGKLNVILAGAAVISAPVFADDAARIQELERRLEELDQKYRVLERRLEVEQESSAEKAKTASTLSIGAQGFTFRSADTNFVLRIRALAQVDSRFYIDDGGNNRNDTFLLRRLRPIIEGTLWQNTDFNFTPEFGGGSTSPDGNASASTPSILDAYVNFLYSPALQFRVGKFKQPVGLEELQSDAQAFFMERGLPSDLTPFRDLGVMVHGEVFDGVFNYAAGVFNGIGDGRNSPNVDFDDEKEGAARFFIQPFLKLENEYLEGFGFGLGGTYGSHDGSSGLPNGNGYSTEGGQQFFTYRTGSGADPGTANVVADGTHWRLSPQAYYYFRSFGLLGEYVISDQVVRRNSPGATFGDLQHTAWQIAAGYVLTGEDSSYKGVVPRQPFSITDHHWGAFELVARYSHLKLDEETFPLFANPNTSAREALAFSGGLNWYANRNFRTSFNYVHTDFKGGASGRVTSEDENAILTRLQLTF